MFVAPLATEIRPEFYENNSVARGTVFNIALGCSNAYVVFGYFFATAVILHAS